MYLLIFLYYWMKRSCVITTFFVKTIAIHTIPNVVQHNACAEWIILPDRRHLLTAWKRHIHFVFSFSDNFINRVRIHSPSPPWHKKPWLGNGHPSHKGVSVHTGFSAKPGGPVWERYSGTVLIDLELIWSFTLYLHILRRPFSDAGNLLRKRKKPPFPLKEERLIIRSWKPAPFLKMEKAGILMASHHKNPGRFKNDNFLKTLYKISTLFQIFPEIINGAAQSLTAYGWYSSKDASQHVCIYETEKNRVHILPLISKLISVDSSWKYPKNTLDATYFKLHLKCWINMCLFNTLDTGIWSYPYPQIPPKSCNFRSQVSTLTFLWCPCRSLKPK